MWSFGFAGGESGLLKIYLLASSLISPSSLKASIAGSVSEKHHFIPPQEPIDAAMAQNLPLLDADVFQQIQQKIDEDTDYSRVRPSASYGPS
jgi:hypothetical protein